MNPGMGKGPLGERPEGEGGGAGALLPLAGAPCEERKAGCDGPGVDGNRIYTARNGREELRNSTEELRNGQEELRNGQEELRNGQEELRNGRETLRNGRKELRSGREEGSDATEDEWNGDS